MGERLRTGPSKIAIGLAVVSLGALVSGGCIRRALAREALREEFQRGQLGQRLRDRQQPGKSAESVQLAGLKVYVWRPTTTGKAPLIIFSHGFSGSGTQSTFLMRDLAAHGYLVVAPNHKDTLEGRSGGLASLKPEEGFGNAKAWSDATYADRRDDIKNLVAAMKSDRNWSNAIDWSRVGLAGHSLGGYTVLGLAGAWPSWRMPDVKAVLALSPYCSPYLEKSTLAGIHVPVMYQGGTRDMGITPFVAKQGGAYDKTSGSVYFVEYDKAGHLAWTDLVKDYQPSIDAYSVAFFDRYLKGDRSADLKTRRSDVTELRAK